MFSGRRRWTWLGLLAAGNLALWVGIAYLVGLCASDELDLGVETLARHVQATAVSSWAEVMGEDRPEAAREATPSTRPPRARHEGEEPGLPLALVAAGTAQPEEPAATVPGDVTAEPPSTESPSSAGVPASAGPPATTAPTVPGPLPTAGNPAPATAVDPGARVEASPSAPAISADGAPTIAAPQVLTTPLLLVDPEFHTLELLNAEMERSAPGRAVQIRYQEEALNQEIATLWINNPALPYRDVKVDLQDNGVAISGQVSVLGLQVDAYLQGTLVARDCLPQLEVESVSLAGIMTPRFVRTRVAALAQECMDWYPADYPLCLEQIILEETRATFYGHHR